MTLMCSSRIFVFNDLLHLLRRLTMVVYLIDLECYYGKVVCASGADDCYCSIKSVTDVGLLFSKVSYRSWR